jgi:DNA repair protein RadD
MLVPPCFSCGWQPLQRGRHIDIEEGELGLVEGGRARTSYSPEERRLWHDALAGIAKECGYKSGWIAHKYKEKFGFYPPWGVTPQPITPSPEIRSWVRSRNIAWARSRNNPNNAGVAA